MALGLSNMLGQRVGGLAGTLPDKSGRPLALLSGGDGGSLGSGEEGDKCGVGGIHIGGAEGGGDRWRWPTSPQHWEPLERRPAGAARWWGS
ncbi:hypothetical protein GUJ93_ZPchr0001g31734 [Zizania palustris]|uniref:Uncharacterized protein n=1 Tax=Zizania palustris TaxID=103762 RepID=A0A8J5UZW2_ZIZPA|nr:hypothetical protein GUJ93_ZPchr0001g31734 [Zizania palustris]